MRGGQRESSQRQERFAQYLDQIAQVAGHADRVIPLQNYTKGLLLPIARKSVEPMAARLEPGNVRQTHQSLHHIVAEAAWSDTDLLREVRREVLPAMTRHHALAGWIVDDTGFPKKGTHSVGVTRQYCGQLGKQENCRVAVSVSLATEQASLPVTWDLYLPEVWAEDQERRKKTGVPEEVQFQTKPEIARQQIRWLVEENVPRAPVLADAAYGNDHKFRAELEELQLLYLVGVQSSTTVWPPDKVPLPPAPRKPTGRPPKLLRRDEQHQPLTVKELALCLSSSDLRSVNWRAGTRGDLRSRFAALRIRAAHRDTWRSEPHPEQWLLLEWPRTEKEPTKYWLSNLPPATSLRKLVATAKLRWRIEQDYEELKQELGLGHFEGRNWRGFHHHASLCIAAYGFLVAERCLFFPADEPRAGQIQLRLPRMPRTLKPRGSSSSN
jgi:SRSO17 transposase